MINNSNKTFLFFAVILFASSLMGINGCSKTESLQLTCSVSKIKADAVVIHSTLSPAKQGVGIQLTVTTNGSVVQQFNRMHNGNTDFDVASLKPNTTYKVELKVINDPSIKSEICTTDNFNTLLSNVPLVSISSISNINSAGATVAAEVTYSDLSPVTNRGVLWSTTANPVNGSYHVISGSGLGSFTSVLSAGLQPATKYHIRAYAVNSAGWGYSADSTFTTLP